MEQIFFQEASQQCSACKIQEEYDGCLQTINYNHILTLELRLNTTVANFCWKMMSNLNMHQGSAPFRPKNNQQAKLIPCLVFASSLRSLPLSWIFELQIAKSFCNSEYKMNQILVTLTSLRCFCNQLWQPELLNKLVTARMLVKRFAGAAGSTVAFLIISISMSDTNQKQ